MKSLYSGSLEERTRPRIPRTFLMTKRLDWFLSCRIFNVYNSFWRRSTDEVNTIHQKFINFSS